jgi:hypothetical protein
MNNDFWRWLEGHGYWRSLFALAALLTVYLVVKHFFP